MKTMKADAKQVCKNIARIIKDNPKKLEQLDKVQSITIHLTSDDGIYIQCELYKNNIVRYLIHGTRCGMTITANTLTNEIVRKPRYENPWLTDWTVANCSDILREV